MDRTQKRERLVQIRGGHFAIKILAHIKGGPALLAFLVFQKGNGVQEFTVILILNIKMNHRVG